MSCVLVILIAYMLVSKGECRCENVWTSEGYITLQEGKWACAPLQRDETIADKGKRFVTCTSGNVFSQSCPSGLRFDLRHGICNWPDLMYCQLDGANPEAPSTFESPTLPSQTPQKTTASSRPVTTSSSKLSTQQRTTVAPPMRPCNATSCKLPDCFCCGHTPSGVSLEDTPMFIMMSFDDHVSTYWYNRHYRALAVDNDYHLYNPNGKSPNFAYFVNHANTDYTKVEALWEAGHEIGSHTYSHRLPPGNKDSDYPDIFAEIQGLKDEVLRATGNKKLIDDILGFRAPFLLAGGNGQYKVLRDNNFLYDSSILNINILKGKDPYWPSTLDYVLEECVSPPCPTIPFPGLWLVQLNGWIGDDGQGCSMADTCTVGTNSQQATEQQWYDYYKRNFESYFYPIKVPMPIFIHATLFDNYPRSYTALIRWLQDTLRNRKDVWLVSPSQVIKWMKHQLRNSDMIQQNWQ